MVRALVIVLSLGSFTACKKDAGKDTVAPPVITVSSTSINGIRYVHVEANKDGYTPARVPGKPGEKLTLVFTRTYEADCISQLKTPDGKLVDLPLNKPVEVAVTVPQTGELGFACGMDMFHGVIVAQPST